MNVHDEDADLAYLQPSPSSEEEGDSSVGGKRPPSRSRREDAGVESKRQRRTRSPYRSERNNNQKRGDMKPSLTSSSSSSESDRPELGAPKPVVAESSRWKAKLEVAQRDRLKALDEREQAERTSQADKVPKPSQDQMELMRRVASLIRSAENPAGLETKVLVEHGSDPRFSFLRKGGLFNGDWNKLRSTEEDSALVGYANSEGEDT